MALDLVWSRLVLRPYKIFWPVRKWNHQRTLLTNLLVLPLPDLVNALRKTHVLLLHCSCEHCCSNTWVLHNWLKNLCFISTNMFSLNLLFVSISGGSVERG